MKDVQGHSALKDQYTVFGEQVGMRIKDIPSSHAKKIIKHLISTILFEAEMGKYDNPNSYPRHPYLQPFYYSSHSVPPIYFPIVPESMPGFIDESFLDSSSLPQPPWNQTQESVQSPSQSTQGYSDSDSIDSILIQL